MVCGCTHYVCTCIKYVPVDTIFLENTVRCVLDGHARAAEPHMATLVCTDGGAQPGHVGAWGVGVLNMPARASNMYLLTQYFQRTLFGAF
jgi:hypothetical protein